MEKEDYLKAQSILPKLHFNLGGHNCHDIYWKNLSPTNKLGCKLPTENSALLTNII